VGNTFLPFPISRIISVHPHACGEHGSEANADDLEGGSSPRLWGTLLKRLCWPLKMRFIPTPVGNTVLSLSGPQRDTVHPHACGEHPFGVLMCLIGTGSSPRLWGTLHPHFLKGASARFIPTPVGNTRHGQTITLPRSVHPHACGEHSELGLESYWVYGSSPRLWGTLFFSRELPLLPRFIPTPVGNTEGAEALGIYPAVHPHACGEHVISADLP